MRVNCLVRWMAAVALGCFFGSIAIAQPPQFDAPAEPPAPDIAPGDFHPAPAFGPPSVAPPMIGEGDAQARVRSKACVRVELEDGSLVLGEFADAPKVLVRAKFGDISLPLSDIARIDAAQEENRFRVLLAGGDRISGELDLGKLSLKTAWGEVPLSLKTLKSLEAGKLLEQTVMESRISPDRRTVVAVPRVRKEFQADVANPDDPHRGNASTMLAPTATYYTTPYPATQPSFAPSAQ